MRLVRIENMDEVLVVVKVDGQEELRIVHPREIEGCELVFPKPLDPEIIAAQQAYETPLPKRPRKLTEERKNILWDAASIGTRGTPEYKRWMKSDKTWLETFGAEYPQIARLR